MKRIRKNSSSNLNTPAIRLEGGLFLPDQLEKAALGVANHQTEQDYRIPAGLKLKDEYSRSFQIASALWKQFEAEFERVDCDPKQLTVKFIQTLLRDALAYQAVENIDGIQVADRHYPISALAGQHIAVVIAPHTLGLDSTDQTFAIQGSGIRKKSPFQMAQEFLNASDQHLWAFVTNGKQLRLIRDADTLTRPSYMEFDLQDMLAGQRFAEFEMAWRLLHASRSGKNNQCIWESWRSEGQQEGARVRDGLRLGVTEALLALGNGFLQHPANENLRLDLLEGRLSQEGYFQQLLRLVYRLIFLFTVEERGILHTDEETPEAIDAREAYAEGYALSRLKDRCLRRRTRNQFDDEWQSLRIVFRSLSQGEPRLALPALGGLFAASQCANLDVAALSNASMLETIKQLRWSNISGNLAPDIDIPARQFGFVGLTSEGSTQGNARKTSGSYYTPNSLVQELIKSALDPVIEDRLANNPKPIEALLNIKVIDPACGSGHFLLAAARRLAERLAVLRAKDGSVRPQDYRFALREVISRCIFGVDRNPMALELARTALWLEGYSESLALSFLDHHLICGDALIGLTDLKQLLNGIPDAAFKPLSGDDKEVCKIIAKANKEALKAFAKLKDNPTIDIHFEDVAGLSALETLEQLPDTTTAEITAKEAAFHKFLQDVNGNRLDHAADLTIAAFLAPKSDLNAIVTTPTNQNLYLELFTQQSADDLKAVHQTERLETARLLCEQARVLHWPLAFPQVFKKGGFDCVLGNPPWERIKLQEEEFFATRNRHVAEARNKAERSHRITWLSQGILAQQLFPELQHAEIECEAELRLHQEFIIARRTTEAASIFAHVKGEDGGRYPLTGVGDINTYALFAETISQIVAPNGRAGFIVPTGIATDDSTKAYFGHIAQSERLASLFDFENREAIFPGVHRSYKFCLLTLGKGEQAEFAFFLTNTDQLIDQRRRFALSAEDFIRINPNTLTCPVFRSHMDAELTRKIYKKVPVLIRETRGKEQEKNQWAIQFMSMFHMSGDSHLFADFAGGELLPLYEGKMIQAYDHRAASVEINSANLIRAGQPKITLTNEYSDPSYKVTPQYWVNSKIVKERIPDFWNYKWLLGFKSVTSPTNERTFIAALLPICGTAHSMVNVFPNLINCRKMTALYSNLNTLIVDYVARTKVGGLNMSLFFVRQFPILPPDFYKETELDFIVSRVTELTYTAHDLEPWAQDIGYDGPPFTFDPKRRARLRAELDAWYAKAYGITREELRYILDPADVMGEDYPSETFRVLKNNEMREFGEYRTRRLVLEAWDKLELGELS